MAQRLAAGVRDVPGLRITRAVDANAVFAVIPAAAAEALRERFAFYDWDASTGEVRWMTAFDTRPEDVDAFAIAIAEAIAMSPLSR